MTNEIFTSKGMLDSSALERRPVWGIQASQITFKEQYFEISTGELVRESVDVFSVPNCKIEIKQGALNG